MGLFSGGKKLIGGVAKGYIPGTGIYGQAVGGLGGVGKAMKGLFGAQDMPQPPGYNGPRFGIAKTEDFIKNEAAPQIGGPEGMQNLQKRFSTLRERAGQQSSAAAQTASDALKRRFSALGAGGGGAQIKLEQQALGKAEEQKAQVMQDINEQEQSALENRAMAQADMDFRNKVFNFERGSKLHELNLAERQQQISQAENEYSARVNQFINQPPKQGIISRVLGNIL